MMCKAVFHQNVLDISTFAFLFLFLNVEYIYMAQKFDIKYKTVKIHSESVLFTVFHQSVPSQLLSRNTITLCNFPGSLSIHTIIILLFSHIKGTIIYMLLHMFLFPQLYFVKFSQVY